MEFECSIIIEAPPEQVFAFLRDKHTHLQPDGSAVLRLEKTSPGPVGVGTTYLEVVRMLPWVVNEIQSVVTAFDMPTRLEENFHDRMMSGRLVYQFYPLGAGTRLIQTESLHYRGLLHLIEPLIQMVLLPKIEQRLVDIKRLLERG